MPRVGDAEKRCQSILEILEKEGLCSVIQLSETLGVTKETIRRDLQLLVSQKKVIRIHGAAALATMKPAMPFPERRNLDMEQKQKVAAAACALVEQGDSIVIESSTTNMIFCEALLNYPELLSTITIITNSLRIVQALDGGAKCRMLFFLGGQLDPVEGRSRGKLTIAALQTFRVSKAFLSAAAIDRQMRITAYREADMVFQQQAKACADKTYMLVNKSKFPSAGLFSVCQAQELDGLVSDADLDFETVEMLTANGVQVVRA